MNLLAIVKGSDEGSWYQLFPFSKANNCKNIIIVRNNKFSRRINKATWYLYNNTSLLGSIIKIIINSSKAIIKNKIDFVITFGVFPWGILAFIIAKIYNKPISIGFIGTDFNYYLKYSRYKNLIKFVIKRSEIVTVTGNNMKKYLIKKIGIDENKIIIFPHCVENKWFINGGKIKYDLIHVSKLDKIKKVHNIIEAVHLLKLEGIDTKFCIVGTGPEKEFLKQKTISLGVKEEIFFSGYVSNPASFLKQSKIYVQSSKTEGFSYSLVEAMAVGLVPIVTEAGSEKDHIKNNYNGLFYEYGNVEDLKNKIKYVLRKNNYDHLKKNIIKHRNSYRMKNAIDVSEKIICLLQPKND